MLKRTARKRNRKEIVLIPSSGRRQMNVSDAFAAMLVGMQANEEALDTSTFMTYASTGPIALD